MIAPKIASTPPVVSLHKSNPSGLLRDPIPCRSHGTIPMFPSRSKNIASHIVLFVTRAPLRVRCETRSPRLVLSRM